MRSPPRSQRHLGSTRRREGRAHETAAHHPARSLRYVRVRTGGRARRMGGARRVRLRSRRRRDARQARRARPSAPAFSASTRSAGRRWCRSSRRARRTAPRPSSCWRSDWSSASVRPTSRRARPAAEEEIAFAASLSDHPKGMLVAVSRKYEDGAIREVFRTLTPSIGPKPLRGLCVPRGGRRRRAGGARRPAYLGQGRTAGERARATSGCPAATICSIATRAADCW